MLTRTALVALVALHGAAGCERCSGDGDGANGAASSSASSTTPAATRTGSCDRVAGMSVCSEYSGGYLAQNEAVISSGCVKLGGSFVQAECPNTAVLGSCLLSTGEVRKFYGSGGAVYDAAKAEAECAGPYRGKWSVFK